MWRSQRLARFCFSRRSSSWSLTRIYHVAQWLPGSHPAKFKTCLVSARCICLKPHPLALICAKRFRPNHLLPFLLSHKPYARADEDGTFHLAWSSSRQSTELCNGKELFGIVISLDLYWFTNRSTTLARHHPSHSFFLFWFSLGVPLTVMSAGSDFRTVSSLFSNERYLIAFKWEIDLQAL